MLPSRDIKQNRVRQEAVSEAAKTVAEERNKKKVGLLTPSCYLLLSNLEKIYQGCFGVDLAV